MDLSLTRSQFVKTIGAGVLATSAVAGTATAEEAPDWMPSQWDLEADAVVLGFGAAGPVGAMALAEAGLNVLVLEKVEEEIAGGNVSVSGGYIVSDSQTGTPLDVDGVITSTYGTVDREFAEKIVPYFNEVQQYLMDRGVELDTNPDMPGMARAVGEFAQSNGWVLHDGLKAACANYPNIEVRYEHRAVKLIQNPVTREVLGVVADTPEGTVNVKARYGVLVATGDYAADHEMFSAMHCPGIYVPSIGQPYNTGDGTKMLCAAGAKFINVAKCLETADPSLKYPSMEVGTALVFGQAHGTLCGDGYIYVNRQGKRFMNETINFNHQRNTIPLYDFEGWMGSTKENTGYVNMPFWVIFDENTRKTGPISRVCGDNGWGYNTVKAGWHNLWVWSDDNSVEIEKGWILKADTLEELAALCTTTDSIGNTVELDAEGLVAGVAEWNEACEAGEDAFGRTSLAKIEEGPFYAVELAPTITYSVGGPSHDVYGRTVDWNDEPIPRLYAAGTVSDPYIIHTPSLSGAFAWGRICGEQIATLEPWC